MSMKRTPEWLAEHAAKISRYRNAELAEVRPSVKPAPRAKVAAVPKDEPYPNLLVMFAERGIYPPVTEYVFTSHRKFRFDYAWPVKRVALEIDGGIWRGYGKGSTNDPRRNAHSSPINILRDIEKHNLATVLGWRVIRATPDKLDEAVRCVRTLIQGEAAAA
jgi:hypothetical protein